MAADASDPTDAEIEDVLRSVAPERWAALWHAVDAVAGEDEHVTWAGGEQVGTSVVDGEARPVRQMPYAVQSEATLLLVRRLGEAQVFVTFRWPEWHGVQTYRRGDGLDAAPVADAARLATAIVRADRFSEGTIGAMLDDGTLLAALRRIRRWCDERST